MRLFIAAVCVLCFSSTAYAQVPGLRAAQDQSPRLTNAGQLSAAKANAEARLRLTRAVQFQVWIHVDQSGRPADVRLERSSGMPNVDSAAVQIAAQMRFSPARKGGGTVPVWVSMPLILEPRT